MDYLHLLINTARKTQSPTMWPLPLAPHSALFLFTRLWMVTDDYTATLFIKCCRREDLRHAVLSCPYPQSCWLLSMSMSARWKHFPKRSNRLCTLIRTHQTFQPRGMMRSITVISTLHRRWSFCTRRLSAQLLMLWRSKFTFSFTTILLMRS